MARVVLGRRKVQLITGNHLLNLPAVWVRSRGVEKGMEIEIQLNSDGDLVLRPVRE